MRIVVTGGAGFIGSHIVDAYISKGHRVAVLDNLRSGSRKNVNPKAVFYRVDIRNSKLLERVIQREKPALINHHAAVAEVSRSLKDPALTYEVNILGTANVLIAGGKAHIRKIIFSSTGGALYGDAKTIPAHESSELKPLSPYAVSKLAGEEMIAFYARFYGFTYLILRYANVYGPRQNPKGEAGVVAIFTDLMKYGKRPTIFGDGTKTRDYIYVDDVVRANLSGTLRGANTIVNIGLGKEIEDHDVFDAIARKLQCKRRPLYAPFRKGEVYRIALARDQAKRVLHWEPSVNFSEGIQKYIDCMSHKKFA